MLTTPWLSWSRPLFLFSEFAGIRCRENPQAEGPAVPVDNELCRALCTHYTLHGLEIFPFDLCSIGVDNFQSCVAGTYITALGMFMPVVSRVQWQR